MYQYDPIRSKFGSLGSSFTCMTKSLESLLNNICLSSRILSLYVSSQYQNLLITEKNVARVVAFRSASCVRDKSHSEPGKYAIHIASIIPIDSDFPPLAAPQYSISSVVGSKKVSMASSCLSDTNIGLFWFIKFFYN